ncbi:hypothetical protein ACWOFR_08425 [Carnobacterium gallinarum]|uniref:hypothetical protein n=1 Tax=Carnobacterium gallinarum TaxID=2749 RepID=UPI000550CE9C|nr:hypothetical protein [Carnobacterium gallinarum]
MLTTATHLWTIEIESLPFGAEGAVSEAIYDYPKGKTILLPPNDWDGEAEEEFFFDPIGFKNKLIEAFYVTAHEAQQVFDSQEEFQEKANKLICLDARLYVILYYYLNEKHDASTLDSSEIVNQLNDTHLYFNPLESNMFHWTWLEELTQLKFLKLDFGK